MGREGVSKQEGKKQRRRDPGQRLQTALCQTGPRPAGPGRQAGPCSAAVAGQVTGITAHLSVWGWCEGGEMPSLPGWSRAPWQ